MDKILNGDNRHVGPPPPATNGYTSAVAPPATGPYHSSTPSYAPNYFQHPPSPANVPPMEFPRRDSDRSEPARATKLPSIQALTADLPRPSEAHMSSQPRSQQYAGTLRMSRDGPMEPQDFHRDERIPPYNGSAQPQLSARGGLPNMGSGSPRNGYYDQRNREEGPRPVVDGPARQHFEAFPGFHRPQPSTTQPPTSSYPPTAYPGPLPSNPPPYDAGRRDMYPDEHRTYEQRPGRDFPEIEMLNNVVLASEVVFRCAAPFLESAHHPDVRLPTEAEIHSMMSQVVNMQQYLAHLLDMVRSERARSDRAINERGLDTMMVDAPNGRSPDGAPLGYGELSQVQQRLPSNQLSAGSNPPGYRLQDHKKPRRGRTAAPGSCHSCNRSETPEWRRGPDGARTLCNACGLHFAKLERKRMQDEKAREAAREAAAREAAAREAAAREAAQNPDR